MTLSEELKELYASSGTDVILHTLSFNHVAWDSEINIVRDFQDFTANLEDSGPSTVFTKHAFNITGPNKDENGTQTLKITVDAVNQVFVDLLEQAILDYSNSPIEVTYRIYLNSDTTGPQNNPPLKLYMKSVKVNNQTVSGTAELVSLINRKFPNVLYGSVFQSLTHIS